MLSHLVTRTRERQPVACRRRSRRPPCGRSFAEDLLHLNPALVTLALFPGEALALHALESVVSPTAHLPKGTKPAMPPGLLCASLVSNVGNTPPLSSRISKSGRKGRKWTHSHGAASVKVPGRCKCREERARFTAR